LSARTVKVGIIGAGGIAQMHALNYKRIPWVELVGVADIIEERAKDSAKRWGLPEDRAFTDYHDLLELKPDAVSVCTWHKAHAPATIDALNAGVNVLVEKPMATTGDEAYAMYKAAEKNGKTLTVGFQTRYNPELQAAKRFVDSGFLGHPYFGEAVGFMFEEDRRRGIPGETFTRKDTAGGGVIFDEGMYAIDFLYHLLGAPNPISVSGFTYAGIGKDETAVGAGGKTWGGTWDPKKFEVEDFGSAFIRFEEDFVMLFKRAWAMHADSLGKPFVLGTKGGISFDPLTLYTDLNGYMVNITPVHLFESKEGLEGQEFYQKLYDFVVAVRDGTKPPIDPKEIVKEQFIIDGIYKSAQSKSEVKVELPSDLK